MFKKDFDYSEEIDRAATLPADCIGFNERSGWTIEGEIKEDFWEWVNEFTATHPVYGEESNIEIIPSLRRMMLVLANFNGSQH